MSQSYTGIHSHNGVTFYSCFDVDMLSCFIDMNSMDVFGDLSRDMSQEEHLLHPDRDSLRMSFASGNACVVVAKEKEASRVVGYCRIIPLCEDDMGVWYEFGSVSVKYDVRHTGVGQAMYRSFLEVHSQKLILATTTNMAAVSVGKKVGFEIVLRKSLPTSVWRASCTCSEEKVGSSDSSTCKRAYKESDATTPCFFRVTPHTHKILFAKGVS